MPTNTDLVSQLPADFEVFGQAVDTSLADLKGGTTGQVLSKNSNTDMDFTWIANDVGDITAVTAGTGISGGGTSGAVTVTNSMATAIDAKGDLIGGTGADTFARLAVGANGTVLTAASGETTGLIWATPAAPSFVGCSLTKSANQSAADETETIVTFDQETFDTDGFHSNVTNNSRITIPTGKGGKYLLVGALDFATNATGRRRLSFYKNGSRESTSIQLMAVSTATQTTNITSSLVINLVATDYVELSAFQGSGGALDVRSFYTSFSAVYLGA